MFIIARGDAFGGSSLHVRDLSHRLRKDGHCVRILVGGEPDMEVPQRFAEKGLDFVCLRQLGREIHPINDFRAILSLRKQIRRFSPELVSTHASKGGALGRLACVGMDLPVIYTPHCWSFVDGFPRARIYRGLEKCLASITTRIVAVSEDERAFGLRQGVGRKSQTITIHNGVDELEDDRKAFQTHAARPVRIVMVGRFEEQKDQPLLLRALASLRDLPWELTLVGEGPLKKYNIGLARTLGIGDRVIFPGYSSQVEEHLRRSDLFALITNWEGFPRSILEAMRTGLPVIATDIGGNREAVLDGENGFTVPRGDLNTLESILRKLLFDSSLRIAMGLRSRQVFRERFSFDIMYRRYEKLYEQLIRERDQQVEDKRFWFSWQPASWREASAPEGTDEESPAGGVIRRFH